MFGLEEIQVLRLMISVMAALLAVHARRECSADRSIYFGIAVILWTVVSVANALTFLINL